MKLHIIVDVDLEQAADPANFVGEVSTQVRDAIFRKPGVLTITVTNIEVEPDPEPETPATPE